MDKAGLGVRTIICGSCGICARLRFYSGSKFIGLLVKHASLHNSVKVKNDILITITLIRNNESIIA